MSCLFVARSRMLQAWASDVGLTTHIYALCVADDSATEGIQRLIEGSFAGRTDWEVIAEQHQDTVDAAAAIARAARKETLVDPTYYPQIKRAPGIFKVKPANVENHFMVREALENQQTKRIKITPAMIGTYLIRAALG